MLNEDISSLIHEGETSFQRKDYEKAKSCFNEVIKQAPTYAWAQAHLGETYFAIARTEKDSKMYDHALRCFNRALGVSENEHPPKLELGDNYAKYPWALAHRGELLRIIGYQGGIHWKEEVVFPEAKQCFDKAIQLDEKYAWAYAHRAATHCSFRDGDYNQALQDLNTALELTDYIYPWCLAYRAVAYILLGKGKLAFYNLFSAVVQDKSILDHLIYPARELQQQLRPQMLFLEAMIQYNEALKLPRDNRYRLAYIQYHNAVVHKYCSVSEYNDKGVLTSGYSVAPLRPLQPASKPGSNAPTLPDKEETKEGVKAAILNACEELIHYAMAKKAPGDKGLKEYEDAVNTAITNSCTELRELTVKLGREEIPHIYYIIGGLYALEDRWPEAVDWLQKALQLKPKLQEEAAQDMAWYWLRNDPSFKALMDKMKKKNRSSSPSQQSP